MLKKFFKLAAYFSNSKARTDRLNDIAERRDDSPVIKFAMFYNEPTRISAVVKSIYTIIRRSKALSVYLLDYPHKELPNVTQDDWKTLFEFHGIGQISALVGTWQ